MIHRLETPWTLYFQKSQADDNAADYSNSIHRIGKFDTVESFWSYFSHLKRPNEIGTDVELHVFRNDVRGMWEDDENRNGGKWLLFLKKDLSAAFWERSVLALIGEMLHEDVIGTVISVREGTDILSFWTKTGREPGREAILSEVAETIANALNLPAGTTMRFKQHYDSRATEPRQNDARLNDRPGDQKANQNNNRQRTLSYTVGGISRTMPQRPKRNVAKPNNKRQGKQWKNNE